MWLKRLAYQTIGLGVNVLSFFAPKRAGELALGLFITPPAAALRPKEKAFLDTARNSSETRAGKPIIRYEWGEAGQPYVLLSYGWGYNAGRWRHFVPALVEAGYRVIAYDPTGHGQAPKGRLHFVDNMNIIIDLVSENGQPAAIIAHSFGGACSVQAMDFLDRELHPPRMVVMASFSHAEQSVFQTFRKALGLRDKAYKAYVAAIARTAGNRRRDFNIGAFSAQLGHIQALIVHDPKDAVTNFIQAQGYTKHWPGSRLLAPEGAGHHLGQQAVTDQILEFALAQVSVNV